MIFVFTSDVDFVSDDVLRIAYRLFDKLPLTIFMTGQSKYIEDSVLSHPRWQTAPHPNFCYNSSHGKNIAEVFSFISNIKSEKECYRCHRYYSSNDVNEEFVRLGYKYSSNICTDCEMIRPFKTRNRIIEFPIFFEDGGYLKYHGVPHIKDLVSQLKEDGVYVFNFHPIHIAINTCDFNRTRNIKSSMTYDEYQTMKHEQIVRLKNNGYGIYDFITDLIEYANKNNVEILNLKETYEKLY